MNPRLLALCFGNFVIGTGTLIVPGMLTVLAAGLAVPISSAGRLIAAFAFTVCVLAPLLAGMTSRFERRALLVAMLALFALGHLGAVLAPNYDALFATRVISAIAAGLFTSQAAGVAGLVAPPEKRGAAIAFVFLGWSIASVLGMPLGAWIGESFGWRVAFAVVVAMSVIGALAVRAALPGRLMIQPIDRAAWRTLFGSGALLVVISVTAVQAWAQFTVFSYLTPIFKTQLAAGAALVSVLLAAFGAAGIVGNVVAARVIDRVGAPRVVLVSLALMLAGHVIFWLGLGALGGIMAGLIVWGLGCFAINSAQQARLVGMAPGLAPVSIALNTSGIYLGQAAGAETGARLIESAGIAPLFIASVPLFVVSAALSVWVASRAR